MNSNYRFTLHVELPNHDRKCSAFEVDAFVAKEAEWDPYDLCGDSFTAALVGGVTSLGAERIDTERKKLAEEIAYKITAHIMNAIKSRDLKNGYAQKDL